MPKEGRVCQAAMLRLQWHSAKCRVNIELVKARQLATLRENGPPARARRIANLASRNNSRVSSYKLSTVSGRIFSRLDVAAFIDAAVQSSMGRTLSPQPRRAGHSMRRDWKGGGTEGQRAACSVRALRHAETLDEQHLI